MRRIAETPDGYASEQWKQLGELGWLGLVIPERYGIYQTVGDTVGPGGLLRALRNVPVFLERFGLLETTRDEIERCVDLLRDRPEITAFEVETYTWEILPDALRGPTLADGIARELDWIRDLMARERAA